MHKQEFLERLQKGLSGLPQDDIEQRLTFYSEMIDDRMEDGLSEQEAVSDVGDVDAIVTQIIADIPFSKLVREKIKPKKHMRSWEIVLLVLGSPVWLSLLIAAVAVLLSLYISLWAVIISVWAVFASFVGCAIGGIVAGSAFIFGGNVLAGIAMVGAAIVCIGFSVFLFYGCKVAAKGVLVLTKKLALGLKNCFRKKGEAI